MGTATGHGALNIVKKWYIVDAKGLILGRLATRVATILMGKHKPTYTRHIDTGDAVIVLNAAQVGATGNKERTKMYHRHSGYPGGIKSMNLAQLRQQHPERIIEYAVKRMLPKGPLGRDMYRKLHVYAGTEHPHEAQQPKAIEAA